jgi:hypothetical protein
MIQVMLWGVWREIPRSGFGNLSGEEIWNLGPSTRSNAEKQTRQ